MCGNSLHGFKYRRAPLKTIEGLGHSATAYKTAVERLERKFGGQCHQVALYLEEVDNLDQYCQLRLGEVC